MIESTHFLLGFFIVLVSMSLLFLFIYSFTILTPEKAINI